MISITLTVTTSQLLAIAQLLNTSPDSISEPTSPKLSTQEPIPSAPTKTLTEPPRVKGIKMPTFGRSISQIQEYAEAKATRKEELDEEAELKRQRKEERDAAAYIKQQELEAKAAELEHKQREAEAIKAAVEEIPVVKTMPKRTW